MATMASTTRDFSELSVSTNSPPSRKFEPIDFSKFLFGSIAYTRGSVDVKFDGSLAHVPHHEHVLVFEGDHFPVNVGPERDPNDPCNAELLESVKNYNIHEEFAADGLHIIRVVRTCKSFSNVEFVRDKRLDEYYRFMSCELKM